MVAITTVPRADVQHHKTVDVALKDLKFCSRRLKQALDRFKDELRVLERLYYKCRNQHRTALFFRRVSEIRRYGRRLCALDTLERVDLLRASFVGLDHTDDHKALRSSWTRLPEKPHICLLADRLAACSDLVGKMHERLLNASRHFSLAMQTGAFVQVIVLFVGIASRMAVLSSELGDALGLGMSACNRLLHPTPQSPLPADPLVKDEEDVGQSVSRQEPTSTVGDVTRSTIVRTQKTAVARSQKSRAKPKLDEIDEIFSGF